MTDDSGSFGDMLQNLQQLQGEIQRASEQSQRLEVEGTAGAGLVTAKANGKGEIVSIAIDPNLYKDGDLNMMQDLVRGACNNALKGARDKMQEEMQKAAGGILGGLGFPTGGVET